MKNPYLVLSEKEEHAARVRKEIEALLIVIPLLDEKADEIMAFFEHSTCPGPRSVKDGMAELELYYPFVKNLRLNAGGTV